jgi:hypothetical protein
VPLAQFQWRATQEARRECGKSAVQNGKAVLPTIDHRSVHARRYKEILSALISDQGRRDNMSEARFQLSRRYAAKGSLS